MQLNPYLLFNGDCEEAFKFYEQCLGAKIEGMITNGESPMAAETPPERHNKILHARLTLDGQTLMGSDAPPERYDEPTGIWVSLGIEKREEAERIFGALSENGKMVMPIQETFWAIRFGMVIDRFGIPWMVNCERAA